MANTSSPRNTLGVLARILWSQRAADAAFRIAVIALLAAIARDQAEISRKLDKEPISRASLRAADPDDRKELANRIPLVRVEGTVDVSGHVDVR